MKTIYKYTIEEIGKRQQISFSMPRGAQFRSLLIQNNRPVLYYEVNADMPVEARDFFLLETGKELVDGVLWFCGSVALFDGDYVLHIYEDRKRFVEESEQEQKLDNWEEEFEQACDELSGNLN